MEKHETERVASVQVKIITSTNRMAVNYNLIGRLDAADWLFQVIQTIKESEGIGSSSIWVLMPSVTNIKSQEDEGRSVKSHL